MKSLGKKIALSLFSFFLIVAVVEKFIFPDQNTATPIVIQDAHSTTAPSTNATIPDDQLIWKFNPGVEFNGRIVNRLGFLDREVDPIKKPGVLRVICMGDSCTGQGPPPYSGHLNDLLINNPPTTQTWEAFNMGVHGYSSVQGLRLFQLRGKALQPDIVTIYYGWNDHWLGESDRTRMGLTTEKTFLSQLVRRFRKPTGFRVEPDEYKKTLTQFVQEIRAIGADPILITAPRTRLTGQQAKSGLAHSREQAEQTHDQYVEITRDVTHEQKAELLDLAAMQSSMEQDRLFMADGIHFNHEGLKRIAELLHEKITDMTRRSK